MEQCLIRPEILYQTIFETTSFAILIIEKDGTILAKNNVAKGLLGLTEADMDITYNWLDFIIEKDRARLLQNNITSLGTIASKYNNKDIDKNTFNLIDKKGNLRVIHLNLAVVPGTQDIVISALDITQIKQSEQNLKESYDKLHRLLGSTISALCGAIKQKDSYTAEHQKKVASLACAIAKEMHLPEEQIEGIKVAGMLHDIGKISIPSGILNKPGKLSENEFSLVKEHVQIGNEIVKPIDFPWPVATIILQHHERINGSGYPNGLTGEDLLIESKIIAVADTIDAMLSHRPYRPAKDINEAVMEITRQKDILYDGNVVNASLKLLM